MNNDNADAAGSSFTFKPQTSGAGIGICSTDKAVTSGAGFAGFNQLPKGSVAHASTGRGLPLKSINDKNDQTGQGVTTPNGGGGYPVQNAHITGSHGVWISGVGGAYPTGIGGQGGIPARPGEENLIISFPEADPVIEKVAIAYNPYSVDSLVGAALALHLPGNEDARCIPYNPFGSIQSFTGFDEIMFVGVEVTQLDYTVLRANSSNCKLNLVCYRDSYVWLTEKMLANASTTAQRFMPGDEMFSDLTARTDNTATKVMQFLLDATHTPIPAFGRNDVLDLVARQVSQSYPIMPMIVDLGEGVDSNVELANKARIHDLVPKLRMALASFTPLQELADITLVSDVSAYLSHFRHVRYALSRSLHMRAFGRGGVNYALPVSPASELTHGDILHAALQNYDEVLTYEDVGEFRVWRIHSPKVYDRRAIAQVFKPLMLWSEGVVLCAVTNLTTYSN